MEIAKLPKFARIALGVSLPQIFLAAPEFPDWITPVYQALRMILICVAFISSGLIAFVQPHKMADAFPECTGCSVHLCAEEGESHSHPQPDRPDPCPECHDSSLHFLTDLSGQGDRLAAGSAGFCRMRIEHARLPEGPYLDEIEPPLI